MDGLKPVSKLPPRSRNGTGTGEEIMRMLSEFLDSGVAMVEVTRDVDGEPLSQRRIDPLRTHMYKVAGRNGIEIKTFVRWDEDSGRRRLYLGKAGK